MSSMNEAGLKDKRQAILAEAAKLVDRVEQAYDQGEAMHELEQGLFRQLLRLGYQLVEGFFELCGPGDHGAQVELSDGRQVTRLERKHGREYQSVFGVHALERVVYGTREGQQIEYVPLDSQLQLPASKFSYLLQEWDQALAVEQPYGQVSETVERILGFPQSVHSLERLNQQVASSVEAFWAAREPAPVAQGEAIVTCSADGKGVVMRRESAAAAPHTAAGIELEKEATAAKAGGKKMALLGAVYTIAPYVRTPEQVLAALFEPPPPRANPPPRPKPRDKYVRASLARDEQGTMAPSYACIFSWLAQEQRQRNPTGHQPVVVLMDGQKALWLGAQHAFEGVAYVEVLDLLHALGYVWDAAKLFYPNRAKESALDGGQPQRLAFVKQQTERLLTGQVQTLIRSLRAQARRLSPAHRDQLADILGYFQRNAPRMQYDHYLHAGYPIASGVIEGACRHVVCDRMERSGMRWGMPGAQAMLGLRCIGINQDWEAFMSFHIARENDRLYPVQAVPEEEVCPLRLVA
jgi:hypothetical protein